MQIVKDIKTSRRPRDMHFNDDHSLLYVACGDDDVIDVIDVAKLEVVGKIATCVWYAKENEAFREEKLPLVAIQLVDFADDEDFKLVTHRL